MELEVWGLGFGFVFFFGGWIWSLVGLVSDLGFELGDLGFGLEFRGLEMVSWIGFLGFLIHGWLEELGFGLT